MKMGSAMTLNTITNRKCPCKRYFLILINTAICRPIPFYLQFYTVHMKENENMWDAVSNRSKYYFQRQNSC